MQRFTSALAAGALLLQIFGLPAVHAAVFPDVPDGHMYQAEIEMLVGAQVIGGNPDGTFAPDRAVNRAEMLKMLYKAKGKTPDPIHKKCFSDVPEGAWFESYVCDAAANRYVQGYADGSFRPGNLVNRVEALKMIMEVFDLEVDDISEEDREIVKFVDVSVAAWYTKYLFAGFINGILPIAGQDGSRFYPDWPLLRGEAAAYIFNALHAQLEEERSETEEQMEEEAEENMQEETGETSETGGTQDDTQEQTFNVTAPFATTGKFDGKKSVSYLFTLSSAAVLMTDASLQSGQMGSMTCRLYLLGASSFSDEYYLGFQEGHSCYLKTAVPAGNYQLQLQPSNADTTFSVSVQNSTGDGNDGFMQAVRVKKGDLMTQTLTSNDLQDFYRFTVTTEAQMTVGVSDSQSVKCIVYPLANVNLASFSGPECGHSYRYTPGDYIISVGRGETKSAKQTYTIQLQ
jgi:hypothetical protein